MPLFLSNKPVYLSLLLSILLTSSYCDCPITRYHPFLRTGQIQVTQSQATSSQIYTHTLTSPLFSPNPTVIIGITGFLMSVNNRGEISFDIKNVKQEDLSVLKFLVQSKESGERQKSFSFRFLVVERTYVGIQGGMESVVPVDNMITSDALEISSLSITGSSEQATPQIAIFITGITATNTLPSSASSSSPFTIHLLPATFSPTSHLLTFNITSSSRITYLSYSYLMYNSQHLSQQNQISLQTIPFITTTSANSIKFKSLQYTGLTFFGLTRLGLSVGQLNAIDMVMDDSSSTDSLLMVQSNTKSLSFEVVLWQSFVKDQNVCDFCKDASILYDNRYCVSTCPKDLVPQQTQSSSLIECKRCSIQELRIIDPSTRQLCICAAQHFQHPSTKQCTPCHYTCLTCIGESSMDCLTCDINSQSPKLTHRELAKTTILTGKCLCPLSGFYEEDANIRCVKCHPDCKTCAGSSQTECTECNNWRTKNQLGVCQCKAGYTSRSDGSCKCMNPKYEANGVCLDPLNSCGVNEVQVVTQNLKSNNGKNNKTSSTSFSTKTCQCLPGFNLIKGQCLQCPLTFQYNSKKGTCQCPKQSTLLPTTNTCLTCPNDKRFDLQTSTCQCKNKNHFLNTKGECITCPAKSIYWEDRCYCVNNYYMSDKGSDKGKCKKCKKESDHVECKRYDDGLGL